VKWRAHVVTARSQSILQCPAGGWRRRAEPHPSHSRLFVLPGYTPTTQTPKKPSARVAVDLPTSRSTKPRCQSRRPDKSSDVLGVVLGAIEAHVMTNTAVTARKLPSLLLFISLVALVDIAVLCCLIVSFIIVSRRYSVAASWLFVPYAIWVGFAAALNASIWSAN
jgi:hypothetical protein